MRQETIALVECARALGVELAPSDANPDAVRLTGRREDFSPRLAALRRALDAWDAAASARASGGLPASAGEEARLRQALDAVFRWMRGRGIDPAEAAAFASAALAAPPPAPPEGGRAAQAPAPRPSYAPEAARQRMKPKPLLTLAPEQWQKVTLGALRQRELQARMTLNSMGAAAPR